MTNLPQTIIGCFLLDNSLVDKAIEAGLRPDMLGAHAGLFDLCIRARAEGKEFDGHSLTILGASLADVSECMDAAPTSLGFSDAINRLIWQAKRTHLAAQAKDLITFLKTAGPDERDSASSRVAQMQAEISPQEDKDESIADVVESIITDLDADLAGKPRSSIELSWGLPDADRFLMPIRQHELVILAARPSKGKSSLGTHLALTWLKTRQRVALFSLETSKAAVLKQIAGQEAAVNIQRITQEPKDKIDYYKACLRRLSATPNLAVYDRVMTLDGIEAKCRLLASSMKPTAVIVDYLNIIHHNPSGKGGLYEKTTEISQRMIGLRKHLNCPLILLAQLNRANVNDNRQPEPHDLRDSGSIEQDAHRLVFIHRPEERFDGHPQATETGMPPDDWHTLLLQKKLRDGPLASIRTVFNAPTTRFLPYTDTKPF